MTETTTAIEFDQGKFDNLVLYIAHRCRNDERFGSVKLSKILYYCDFEGFKRNLRPITGATYLNKPKGPYPAELAETRRRLVANGEAFERSEQVINYRENRFVPTNDHVELDDRFSAVERQKIDNVIDRMQNMNATELADYSHGEFGWKHTGPDAPIPYATALIARDDAPWVKEYIAEREAPARV